MNYRQYASWLGIIVREKISDYPLFQSKLTRDEILLAILIFPTL